MPVLKGAAKVMCLLEEIKVKEYNKSNAGCPIKAMWVVLPTLFHCRKSVEKNIGKR